MNGAARTLLVLALASLPWGCASDDAWPSSPITIVCPWSAGGGTDQVSRQIALYLEEDLGVPVAVVNAVGGAGVTGHATGARARPDGTTLLMATVELNMLHWRDLTRLTWEDYAHLALLNRDAAAIFVRSDSPWSTAAELLDAARTTPGRLRASGTSTGGIWHLALAGWLVSEGLPPDAIRWISSAGAGPSLNELASRGVDVVCASVPEARSFLEGSKDRPAVARALGVMSERPVRGYESIPTFPSLGFDWTLEGWRGLVAPKGTPEPIVAKLRASLERILLGEVKAGDRTFVEAMRAQTFDASWGRADEFRTLLAATDEKLGRLLTSPDFVALDDKSFPLHAFPGAIA
ncbi:MAG TPA: tripartite tricarboxylate transporter substrate binding protein, partial [Planctomycetota bacterium]|nr:tripartite tricarboxylate transporter substrate binding protein [Planctomycetota bacterium]